MGSPRFTFIPLEPYAHCHGCGEVGCVPGCPAVPGPKPNQALPAQSAKLTESELVAIFTKAVSERTRRCPYCRAAAEAGHPLRHAVTCRLARRRRHHRRSVDGGEAA